MKRTIKQYLPFFSHISHNFNLMSVPSSSGRKRSRSSSPPTVTIEQAAQTAPPTRAPTALKAAPMVPTVDSSEQESASFEKQHVHGVYDNIAAHFSSTRYKPWPLVRQFVEELPKGSFLADVGCGNGKNIPRQEITATPPTSDSSSSFTQTLSTSSCVGFGCDYSGELLRFPATSGLEVCRGDALNVPYRSNAFDAAISIAVIHHFSTPERRAKSIEELSRIVKPGGRILIYVWAREQPKRTCPSESNGDVLVPWEMHKKFDNKETVHARYYHFFQEGEMEGIVEQMNAKQRKEKRGKVVSIQKSYYDKENWCIILQVEEPLATV